MANNSTSQAISTAVEVPTPDRFPEAPAIAAISVPALPATSKVRRALTPRAPLATPRVAQLISPRALKRRRAPAQVIIRPSAASRQPAAATKPSPPSSPVPGLQPVFTAVSTAAPPTPTSPVPGSQPAFSHSDDEEPPPRACIDLLPWNLKEFTLSPPSRTRPPRETLSPWDIRVRRRTSPRQRRASATLPPRTTSDKENVHQGTQTNISWVSLSSDESSSPEKNKWGPIRVTLTKPHIFYRERLIRD
ncbi:proline-rich receptor-like protein kinase PERK9 [Ooceraea biroi]|uniref:proline-rich receptor-like protein kinase PERK9 n=1 Tax=Ooceraea biroi TaxID=2015173 RepID=UPI000F082737|nr:proline-rich receptor-like protein kinase PERK9 [Ooceraea biroi]